MSIIYDALQKTQKARQGEAETSQDKPVGKPAIDSSVNSSSMKKRFNMKSLLSGFSLPGIKMPASRLSSVNWRELFREEYIKPAMITGISAAILSMVFVLSRTSSSELPAVTMSEMHADVPAKAMTEIKNLWQALIAAMPKRRTIIEAQYKKNHILNGVFISNSEKIAMINNRMFHRGDEVDGMIISEIDTEGVQLKHDDQMIFLRANL